MISTETIINRINEEIETKGYISKGKDACKRRK